MEEMKIESLLSSASESLKKCEGSEDQLLAMIESGNYYDRYASPDEVIEEQDYIENELAYSLEALLNELLIILEAAKLTNTYAKLHKEYNSIDQKLEMKFPAFDTPYCAGLALLRKYFSYVGELFLKKKMKPLIL